ncbi:outer membrane beta-barrel protein [Aureispira anguillae]|uniref:Outer membrane beta-barrel protein n=1 Tax=Aureispira anguillae TaxID=2864201 RepID=A0A915YJC5_9BACT|nr:outer membrane beta-barrel protein [Aureispira anguillae]BDS14267.1 outer membrane beta-barrel protein [Aureispira anguillae]
MRIIYLFILLITTIPLSYGQTYYALDGHLVDETATELVGATVLLLNLPDSTMEEYALTNEKGIFKITAPKNTSYLLQISYMGYETYSQEINLSQKVNLGTIVLKEKSEALASVEVVEERIPMRMKGDTLEYSADAFHTQEHDNVEALLKKLPGVEVDRDGQVKAQGEAVDRILVDGKEFFGDNPEIAMKNLPADAINKVQVYDRKSEMAEFSGVDDGVKRKTINLKLKADKKHGFFGHVDGGYGYTVPSPFKGTANNHRYRSNLSLNYFNPTMRVSTIGAFNNVNEQSFSFMDYINLMGGIQSMMSGGGSINLEINGDDPLGALLMDNKDGIARTLGGGANFNWFISDKTEWSTHYFYSIMNKRKEAFNEMRSIGLNSFFTRNGSVNSNVQAGNHNLNSSFKHKFDPTQDLKFQLKFKWNDALMKRSNFEQTFGANQQRQNEIHQHYNNQQNGWGLNANVLHRKKFKKKGRVLMTNLIGGYSNRKKETTNISRTQLYNDGGTLRAIDSLNQEQYGLEHQQIYGVEISFVEPIAKHSFLDIQLTGMFNFDTKDKKVYDVNDGSNILNNELTNLFQKQYNYQTLTTRFQRTKKSFTLTLEASLQRSYLKGIFSNGQTPLARTYYYPLAVVALDYKISQSSNFIARYATNIKEPRIEQLQPILNNNSPLSLYVGNPNLNPEYHHNLSLRYNLFDQFSFTSFFATASFAMLQNQIVDNQMIDDNFRITYRPENSAVGYQGNLYVNFSRPIKPLGVKFNLGANGQFNSRKTLINEVGNTELTQQYTFKASVENRKKQIVDALVGAKIEMNKSTFSINNSLNIFYLNYVAYADLKLTIAKKWNISSSFDYNIYANEAFANDIYIPIWSASISRTFLKANQLKIELRAFNILDQQVNVQRFSQNETIGESRTNTLGRYFMISARYKITQVGAKKPNGDFDFQMDRER